ncbi:Uncharacterised protein [Serratia plymuthica]|nr:Uncharacterised protein [Serratia plymuthica]
MKRRTRINYTPEQKAIIWDRYKQGDSLHDIANEVQTMAKTGTGFGAILCYLRAFALVDV